MAELWFIAAGILISATMGLLKTPLAWLRRQHDVVKALVVVALSTALYFLLKLVGADPKAAEIPVAALVAMGVRAFAESLKNVWAEPAEEKEARLNQ